MLHGEPPAPQLIAYARAFLMLNRPEIRFYFMGDDGWRSVLMERNSLDIARDGVATVYVGNATLPSGMTKREIEILTLVAGGLGQQFLRQRRVYRRRGLCSPRPCGEGQAHAPGESRP